MAEQQVVDWAGSDRPGVRAGAAPEMGVRMVGALLALAIGAVHVADQGGISSLATGLDRLGLSAHRRAGCSPRLRC
jgi:hypothetical protein